MVAGDVRAHYATDRNLAAQQRLWAISKADPAVSFYDWFLDIAAIAPEDDVLEVGCGNGPYLERVPVAMGLDLSMGMLAVARTKTSAPLVNGDVERLPFADASFDVVLAPHMLYHVPDRRLAVQELRRITRDGGRCVAATNGATNNEEMVELVEAAVGCGWRWERSAVTTFSLENGADQLRAGFHHVERRDTPERVVHVTDASALADYLRSVADIYESQIDAPWDDVVEECRRRAQEIIDRDGALLLTSRTGAFVCS
jgi:SAM-dependent methyltransferase